MRNHKIGFSKQNIEQIAFDIFSYLSAWSPGEKQSHKTFFLTFFERVFF